ncbi:MAM domain-containing protein 2-like [Periophthalmus magnuspinnatus]|uniref:MAM domain-containing protein 2-like n=1 Tax=Periophthalmus magnuspinnatus TaxID=409849 RepID=UPI0024370AAD|nr:MAM domain-containing protein 2-like [Periophthalmus magnuspinnatus]
MSMEMLLLLVLLGTAVAGGQKAPGSCSFETHTCGYTSDPDYEPWSLHSEGHFVAVEADSDRMDSAVDTGENTEKDSTHTNGETSGTNRGLLLSPLLEVGEWSCLRLVYQVTVEGSLNVLLRSEGQSFDRPLWSTKSPSESWLISSVDLSNITLPFRVVIDGTSGSAAGSSVSLFEIHISPGYCLECDFEDSHLCGYSNQWNANVNWYVGGEAVQLNNDFSPDPTSNNHTGHFMYVDSLHAVIFQEVAKLVSPMTTAPMSGCLSFQYQRSKAGGNLFSVYTRDRLGQYQELWRPKSESQGPEEWELVQVDLKAPYSVQVVFEVAFSSPRGGRVAVDDISFSPQFCSADTEPTFDPSVGSCDFEEGLCAYAQGHGNPWRRISVKPNLFRNGDHTTGAGSFLLAHSQLSPGSTYVSRLLGPNLPSNTKFCLRFYFSLRGFNQTAQALSVHLQHGLVQEKIWTQGEKSKGIWIQGDVSITTSTPSKVVFVSVCRSLWDCGSVALDDITLDLGHCELVTGLPSLPAQCDFESGFCGYSQDRNTDDADWHWRRGPTPTSYTGPQGDHSTGLGYYVHLEASPLLPGQSARLRSPSLRGSRGPQCLLFHFHMYGSGIGRLSVHVDEGGDLRTLWGREGEQSMGWLRAQLQFQSDRQHQIVFEATRGLSIRSDIAIDDIQLESGPCPAMEDLDITGSSNELE